MFWREARFLTIWWARIGVFTPMNSSRIRLGEMATAGGFLVNSRNGRQPKGSMIGFPLYIRTDSDASCRHSLETGRRTRFLHSALVQDVPISAGKATTPVA